MRIFIAIDILISCNLNITGKSKMSILTDISLKLHVLNKKILEAYSILITFLHFYYLLLV
jgi:hypothetical protein